MLDFLNVCLYNLRYCLRHNNVTAFIFLTVFIVQIALLSFPQIIWPLALGRAARVNRPQLISLNGRPSLFPELSTKLLLWLLRHLLNCSLLSPTQGSSTNWSGFFDWDLDVDPR